MAHWEFCKIERETVGSAADSGSSGAGTGEKKPQNRRGGDRFTERLYMFRMTAQLFTPDGLKCIDQTEEYKAFLEGAVHNEMGEMLMAKLGQQGWEPFFTDTRSSQDYFTWHLKRAVNA